MNDACICIDADNQPSFHSAKIQKARKPHKCGECGATIELGQKYEYVCGTWDGEFDTYKTCLPCKGIRDDFFSCGFYYGGIWEELREHFVDQLRQEHGWEKTTDELIEKELSWLK